jgi:hypothetical protein
MAGKKGAKSLISKKDLPAVKRASKTVEPHNQRAKALLAVHDGASHEEAAKVSGLRTLQVSYWVRRFTNTGLDCFPEELLAKEKKVKDISKALKKEKEKFMTKDKKKDKKKCGKKKCEKKKADKKIVDKKKADKKKSDKKKAKKKKK